MLKNNDISQFYKNKIRWTALVPNVIQHNTYINPNTDLKIDEDTRL